ncbi:hypothetical protein K457DRAFT_26292 [Linnemannia elongata AG-77]|uniref:Uncharacterized protein n=1 Tax=Linnemannia elongata AG-77 TaxID=1314771 RepID=A0A197JCH3_9FUNG|nr:hypothetical protein K457DRAFT_26292 [Linnemannia elongata AG-77]
MPIDHKTSNNQPDEQPNNSHSTTNPSRSRIYYWGVQVTLPVYTDNLSSNTNISTFRIVTMGDGFDDELESCWWNVDFRSLNHSIEQLTAPPIVDRESPYSPVDPEIIPPDLLDLTIFGNNLIVTLTTGHLVWSFYGRTKSSYFNPKSLGLQSAPTQ